MTTGNSGNPDPAQLGRILDAVFGGPPPGASAADMRKNQAGIDSLKAAGWSDDDVCALSNAIRFLEKFHEPARRAAHLGTVKHANQQAARVALAMFDLALDLSDRVDDAFRICGWPTQDPAEKALLRDQRKEIADDLAKLVAEQELRASVRAQATAGGAP